MPKQQEDQFWGLMRQMIAPMTDDCVAYSFEELASFTEGRLKRSEKQAVEAHTRYCRPCRHIVLELRQEVAQTAAAEEMVKTFGAFEARLMNGLWQAGRGLTAEELFQALSADLVEASYPQVLSGLTSLLQRGFVKRTDTSRGQVYSHAVNASDLQSRPLPQGLAEPAFSYFLHDSDSPLSLDDAADAPPADDPAASARENVEDE